MIEISPLYNLACILQENIRQLCVFRLANSTGRPWVWWDYVTKFGDECTMKDKKYNKDCAEKVLQRPLFK